MLSGRAGLIWQPSAAQSYYVSWGNSYNPSGELGVYGGTAATQSDCRQPKPRSGEESELRSRRAVGLFRGPAIARRAFQQREDQRAHSGPANRRDGPRRQAPRRGSRVRGVGCDHAELGDLQRHRFHGRRDRQRSGKRAGQHTARSCRRGRQHLDHLSLRRAAGRSAAACADRRGLAHRHQHSRLEDSFLSGR